MSSVTATGADEGPELDRRAAEEYMTVLPNQGRARNAPGLFVVVTESGSEYLVDDYEGTCNCPDFKYRRGPDGRCKHLRRVEFATGARPAPEGVDRDPQLGEQVWRWAADA